MKKLYLLFFTIYLLIPNYAYPFIDLKKYAECDIKVEIENFFKEKKPLRGVSFKYIAYDKEFLYWDYDLEDEVFKEKKKYDGKKFLKTSKHHVKQGHHYWIKFNKINGKISIFAPYEKNLIFYGNCEKTTRLKINKTKFK